MTIDKITSYNKASCRVCGHAFSVAQTCDYCKEPSKWHCRNCGNVDDSTHVHPVANNNCNDDDIAWPSLRVLDEAA